MTVEEEHEEQFIAMDEKTVALPLCVMAMYECVCVFACVRVYTPIGARVMLQAGCTHAQVENDVVRRGFAYSPQ